MSEPRYRLPPDVHLNVTYADATFGGSPVGDRPEQVVREVFAPFLREMGRAGMASVLASWQELLVETTNSACFAERAGNASDPLSEGWQLHENMLYPDPGLAPLARLTIADIERNRVVRVESPCERWPLLHDFIAALDSEGGLSEEDLDNDGLRRLLSHLVSRGLVASCEQLAPSAATDAAFVRDPTVTFVGHNTVVVRSSCSSVLVDPLLFANRFDHPAGYQPLGRRDLGDIGAILITHSHRDHFDAASLMRFDRSTPVIVPDVERETILTIDMERRLRELGFESVMRLAWGRCHLVADIEVHALPFFGEQPTDGDVLHRDVRNAGNTYLIRTPQFSVVVLADSGRDQMGSMLDEATRARRRLGPPDVVFAGYREWSTYAAQLLCSSVGRYAWFVPPWLWSSRLQLMHGPQEAVDVAERFGARWLVPYADGGAPWHWRIGLGPRLDGAPVETMGFDLDPARVEEVAKARAQFVDGKLVASPVQVLVLRPGDAITAVDLRAGMPIVRRRDGHAWPYDETAGTTVGTRRDE